MAINKNFVVRHGLEVDSGLVFANADTNKVGIASTTPRYELDVRGGIGATDVIASGVGTFINGLRVGTGGTILTANSNSYIGIGTGVPIYPLEVRSSGTTTSVYVQGGVKVAGLTSTQDLAVSGVSTFYNSSLGNVIIGAGNTALLVAGDARVTGILTIGTSSITIDGVNNKISVGLGFTITSDGIQVSPTGINTIPNIVSSSANITNLYSSGISTLGVTSVTNLTSQNINNTGITTLGVANITNLTSQNINNTGITTLGVTNVTNLTSQNIYNTGITTLGVTTVTNLTVQNLNVSGINTLSGVKITGDSSAGVATITASAGFTTVYYVGDGSGLSGVVATGNVSNSVIGGIASVTELNVTGITTLGVTSVTNLTSQNINNTGITTLGVTNVTNLTSQNINNTGIATLGVTSVTNLTTQQLNVSGVSTLGITTVTNLTSQNINVSGVVTATTFFGNLTGTASTASASSTAYGLAGNPDIIVGFATVNNDLVVSGNLTVNGTQTIINTSVLDVEDINVGIATTTSKLSNSLLDGAGITIYGSAGDKTLTYSNSKNAFETNIPIATNELRVLSGAEKIVRIDGNTATINYNTTGSNIGLCTNPSGNITLNVNNIPTTSDFDNYSITFAVIVNSTGTARTCTAVNLNGVSRTIKWAGGSLSNSISGVTTTNGYSIYNFTGINTVGSASTTSNYEVFGSVAGGFY